MVHHHVTACMITRTRTTCCMRHHFVLVVFCHCHSVVLAVSSEPAFDSELAALAAEEASIVVLLAEGFDGAVVRTVLSQVRQ